MHLFFADVQKIHSVRCMARLTAAELNELFARSAPVAGTPILLSESMRPVEPLCSWFRELVLNRRSAKTMRAYAYTALMLLLRFLHSRGQLPQSRNSAEWCAPRSSPGLLCKKPGDQVWDTHMDVTR